MMGMVWGDHWVTWCTFHRGEKNSYRESPFSIKSANFQPSLHTSFSLISRSSLLKLLDELTSISIRIIAVFATINVGIMLKVTSPVLPKKS